MLKFGLSLFGKGFKSSKCKTMAKLVTARIKLLRNKREVVVRQMRRDVALLLQSGQDATARIRVEHVMREQNIMAANEIIELFCELVVARLSIIAKQRECPADLKEGISSLIFAAPRCSDIPELLQIRTIFKKKYGEEFVNAATELRPNCGVNRILIEKLSVRTPTGEAKLKLMKEIAKEYQIAWDHTETEKELLKPPEELIEGPHKFVSATSMPVKLEPSQWDEPNQSTNREMNDRRHTMNFEDTATAAKVAAESAEKAVAAAQAAAYLANRQTPPVSSHDADGLHRLLSSKKYATGDASQFSISNDPPVSQDTMHIHNKLHGRTYGSQGYDRSSSTGFSESNEGSVNSQHRAENIDIPGRNHESHDSDRSRLLGNDNNKRIPRRHSYNSPAVHSDINFDESDGLDSDCDEEIEMEKPAGVRHPPPPERSPPPVPLSRAYQPDDSSSYRRNSLPRVHPKLPDYEDISARFEALKNRL